MQNNIVLIGYLSGTGAVLVAFPTPLRYKADCAADHCCKPYNPDKRATYQYH